MEHQNGFNANRMVLQTLSQFFAESELEGLGDLLVGIIKGELRKASLSNPEQVSEVLEDSLLVARDRHEAIKKIQPYLKTVSRNKARRAMRTAIRRMRKEEQGAMELQVLLAGKGTLLEEPSQELLQQMLIALGQLREPDRALLKKTYVQGLSDLEIKHVMGFRSLGAVRTARYRALNALCKLMTGKERAKAA